MATARRAEEESLIAARLLVCGCGLAEGVYIIFLASGCGADW